MRKYRPPEGRGPGDSHLAPLSKELLQVLRDAQQSFTCDSLRLRKADLAQLAEILVEFGEDIHNSNGIWAAYERCNRQFFGVRLPFAATDQGGARITPDRVRHLLWVVYPQLIPGLIVSPRHQDLETMTEAAQLFLALAFPGVPKGSGVKAFLQSPNQHGWDVKRKLVWLGTCSYMFRLLFAKYLDENNRGRWDIGHADDFLCQECTCWSGLGPIDILADVLDIPERQRKELRGWYERHASFYQVLAANHEHLETLNVISDQPYRVRVDSPRGLFKPGQLVFGSLVSWRGEWYWSGEQEIWPGTTGTDVEGLRDTMKRKSSSVLCRFWKEYREQVLATAAALHAALLAYNGKDLVVYPNGLAMAADWQKEMRAIWASKPVEQVRQAVKKHGLTKGRPDMAIPSEMLEHEDGLGVFLNPDEGKEIMCGFTPLLDGLARRDGQLTEEQQEAIEQFVSLDGISPAFVKRVLREHGSDSVRLAFRLPADVPEYWLEYLLRRHKGLFYRTRYPSVAVV